MTNQLDTNVENYTIPELLTILDLDERPTAEEITKASDNYITKFASEGNEEMKNFFTDMENTLLQYVDELNTNEDDSPSARQTNEWYQNEVLKQKDSIQSNKNTDRKGKIDVYNSPHVPMNRDHLGVSNTFSVPVAQDVLNPNLKNTTSRIIVLDSQYRQSADINETSTDYTLDLSEPLLNVLSLRMYSFSIPYTWYVIDTVYGNTCFWITFSNNQHVTVAIDPGNYSPSFIVDALNKSINTVLKTTNITTTPTPVSYNTITGKITINLIVDQSNNAYNYQDHNNNIVDNTTIITFFDPTADLSCNYSCVQTLAINQTLGWVLGFRIPVTNVNTSGNTGVAILDLYGPKYFILVIDDLNQNHINSGLIGITEVSRTLKMPSYYSPDLPYTCSPANPPTPNSLIANSIALANDPDAGLLIVDKLTGTYSPTPRVLPSAPRILTQSQIYSINEIMKNNERTYNYRLKCPVVSDTFAILPIKLGSSKLGDVNTEFGGSMQDNKRVYFGPVNISRMRVKLLDDRGRVVNLNGCDWCVTLISENLYQY